MDFLLLISIGALVGFSIGLTGIGGGSLMTPLLIMLGIPYHMAIGTDLVYAALTKSTGVLNYQRRRSINWTIVATLAAGSLPAAVATALALRLLFQDATEYGPIMTIALGWMLLITAFVILIHQQIRRHSSHPSSLERSLQRHAPVVTFLAGIFLGVVVTLSSVGAGAVGTAVLMILYPALSSTRIVGTDLGHAVLLTLVAGGSHLLLGNVDLLLLGALLIGSLPAVHLGAAISALLSDGLLRLLLAVILLGMGLRFIL